MDPRLAVGWLTFAAAELWLGAGLRHPPSIGGAAVELAALGFLGMIHARAASLRPGTALSLPELPGLALAGAWVAAAAASSTDRAEGGGAPLGGGTTSALLAAVVLMGVGLVAARIPLRGSRPAFVVRAAIAGAIAAVVGLVASARADPTLFPSTRTIPDALAALVPRMGRDSSGGSERIVLVTVDTLRADAATNMESVRRLASRGTTFTDALAAGSWTVPSLGSALTGRWPENHGAGRPGDGWPGVVGLDPNVPTLAERLRDAGWHTAAAATNVFLVPALGFDRGFDQFLHTDARPDAPLLLPWLGSRTASLAPKKLHRNDGEEVVDLALRWLDRARRGPAFLWVHVLDPHLPYHHAVLAPDHPLYPSLGRSPAHALSTTAVRRGHLRDGPIQRDGVRELYAAEVAWADRALLRLLDGIDARGGATILLTADHGEELWDHGGFEHGHAMWPEITHVPFLLARPDAAGPILRDDPVSLVDIAPTILALAGQTAETDGLDVRAAIDPGRLRRMQGTLYFGHQQAVVEREHALVAEDGRPARLYDRAADPTWTKDIAAERPDVAARMIGLLSPRTSGRPTAATADVDAEALRALGYTE
jgi:arylsulfatase A-like enzyme